MYKKLLPAITLLALTGCVSTKNVPIDQSAALQTKPQSIQVTQRGKTDFVAGTMGTMSFGLIGAMMAISNGNTIVAQNSVDDPAKLISTDLSKKLSEKYNLSVINSHSVIDSSDTAQIANTYPDSDWILDIETKGWGFMYFASGPTHYRVDYQANLRLIDAGDKSVLAEGYCSRRAPEEKSAAPTYDELVDNRAELLKSMLAETADYCINEFKTNVLKL